METILTVKDLDFGHASAEKDTLSEWFVETDTYRRIKDGQVDFVLGLKGSGKSSIFKMLPEIETEKLLIAQGNSLKGMTEYEALTSLSNDDEVDNFRNLWKIYTAIVVGQKILKEFIHSHGDNENIRKIKSQLESINATDKSQLRQLFENIRSNIPQIKINTTTIGFSFNSQQKSFRYYDVLKWANDFLTDIDSKCWILFDRLDEFFNSNKEKRRLALEGLLFTYSDMASLNAIDIKIFLRTDIYDTLRFENKDHFSSSLVRINWDVETLQMLISKRIAKNEKILYEVTGRQGELIITNTIAKNIFYYVFEDAVGRGERQATTIQWIYKRILNGQNVATPRDIILFCNESKAMQEQFNYPLKTGRMISGRAVRSAFDKFSQQKLTDYIYAVFEEAKPYVEKLRGSERPKFEREFLLSMFADNENPLIILKRLHEIGVLGVEANKPVENARIFEVPLMYRQALGIKTVGRKTKTD